MFQFIYNLNQTLFWSCWYIIMAIITGKMPKISPYHLDNNCLDNSFIDICSDKYQKIDKPSLVTQKAKELIINEFILHLTKDDKFMKPIIKGARFPIFNGEDIIGLSNVQSVMNDSLKHFLNKR